MTNRGHQQATVNPLARPCRRRDFLRWGVCAAAAPLLLAETDEPKPGPAAPALVSVPKTGAKVAIVRCPGYGAEVNAALGKAFDLLGGLSTLVNHKTVTLKLNLTGTNFNKVFNRPPGDSYMTHYATVEALTRHLFAAGARRVRLVESANRRDSLEKVLGYAKWDVNALNALGTLEYENTRNRGKSKSYAHLPVPAGGHLFSSFEVNQAYADTDVLISLAKLKNHATTGVTLTLKNLFGITPNALYGDEAFSENATAGRGPLHDLRGFDKGPLPGARKGNFAAGDYYRVPRIVADICAARPIDLSIIDGITTMRGGEGFWVDGVQFATPGVLIAGLNPVSTDAVGTAVMGYDNPRAAKGKAPFVHGDNHLVLAEQLGVGTADLSQIEVLGLPIGQARYPFAT